MYRGGIKAYGTGRALQSVGVSCTGERVNVFMRQKNKKKGSVDSRHIEAQMAGGVCFSEIYLSNQRV